MVVLDPTLTREESRHLESKEVCASVSLVSMITRAWDIDPISPFVE